MKKNIYKVISGVLACSLFIISCKTSKPVENSTIRNMPGSFASTKDSVNSATIYWKQHFTDPNLVQLIDVAFQNNLDLSIALQKIEATRAYVRSSKGALFPTVNGGTSAAIRRFGLYTMDGAGNITTEITPGLIVPINLPDYYLGLQASWEIDVWGKLRNKKRAALSRYLSSVEGKNLVVTNLIADLANAYYELLSLDNELDIIKETIKLQENAFELVSIQKEAGGANQLAVKQFEAQVLNSRAMEFESLQRITEVENQINFLLNRYPQPVNREKEEFNKPLPFTSNVGIPSDLLKNRPDIRQAEFELVASKANVKAAKAAFYPSLNITGAFGYQAFKTNLMFTTPESMAFSLFGSLMAPLLNRGAIKAEFKTANAAQQEALFNYQKTILNGYTEVFNQMSNIKNLERIQSLKTNEVAVLSEAIDASYNLFKTGRANYIEVIMIQRSSLDSKLELINVKQRQFNSLVNIYKALGGGWR